MSSRRYDFDDEDDDEFQRTLSNLVNQRDDDLDDVAPSRLGSLLSGSSRSVVDEDKSWNDDRAFIPCGLGHVVFEGLNCFAALVCTGLLGWLVINQILTGCPGFLGSFEFKVDKEGTPLGPFEC